MKDGSIESGETSKVVSTPSKNRGIAIFDFILRIIAIVGTVGAASAMATSDQTLNFVSQFFQFSVGYDDFGTLSTFVIMNGIVAGYLALSLPISIYHIIRSQTSRMSWILLILLDSIMLAILTAGASAAAAIIYLQHNGNASANWFAICGQFQDFCARSSGSLIGSFGAAVAFIMMILLSSLALTRLQ